MSVRAKFKVSSNEQTEEGFQIHLEPVISGSPENEEFYKWTPWGLITLATVNPAAASQLLQGQEYYVDFHSAAPVVFADLHPAISHLLRYFAFQHLPAHLQKVSRPFAELASRIAVESDSQETTVALRKLLEAKDAAVRAML